jgi:hypothetical protein
VKIELQQLEAIHPQLFEMPMDLGVNEAGLGRRESEFRNSSITVRRRMRRGQKQRGGSL